MAKKEKSITDNLKDFRNALQKMILLFNNFLYAHAIL